MNKDLIKFIAKCIISTSVGTVVGNAIKATTPTNLSAFNKVATVIGEFVLTSAAGGIVADYVVKEVEESFSKKEKQKEVRWSHSPNDPVINEKYPQAQG